MKQAAYNHSIDGAPYLLEHFGITLGAFQLLTTHYNPNVQSLNFDFDQMQHFLNYRATQEALFDEIFAKNLGIQDLVKSIDF